MAQIQWDSRLALNVPEIDTQHQKLVAMINDLNAAMQQGKGKEAIGSILDGLVSYTQFHFSGEEKLFDQAGFPGSAAHKLEHVDFVKKVGAFKDDHTKGKLCLSIEIMTYLSDWLIKHIQVTDKKYVPYVVAQSVK
jgi:hemerythrin